jgi:DNA-binding XRE family transcriptional regulator
MSTLRTEDVRRIVDEAVAPLKREIEVLSDMLEDAVDLAAFDRHRHDETFPEDVADRFIAGENPIRVYREYRALSQAALAAEVGTTASYLSQIENDQRDAGKSLRGRLAQALGCKPGDLLRD